MCEGETISPSLESPQKRLFLALKGIKKTDQLSETEICTNSLYSKNLFSFQKRKELGGLRFFTTNIIRTLYMYCSNGYIFINYQYNLKCLIKIFKKVKVSFKLITRKGIMNLYMRGKQYESKLQ